MKFVGDIGEVPFSTVKRYLIDYIKSKGIKDNVVVSVDYLVYSTEEQKFFILTVEGREFEAELLLQQGIWNLMDFKEV